MMMPGKREPRRHAGQVNSMSKQQYSIRYVQYHDIKLSLEESKVLVSATDTDTGLPGTRARGCRQQSVRACISPSVAS
jgi:hypothetical protein